jgi:hypothetical protein
MSLVGGAHLNIAAADLIANLSPVPGSQLQFSVAGYPSSRFVPYVHIQDETFNSFPTMG